MGTSYFKPSSTVDPRSLQGSQAVRPMPQEFQSGKLISTNSKRNKKGLTALAITIQPKPEKASKAKAPKDPNAPKKPKTKAKKAAAEGAKADGQFSESESEESSDEDVEEPPEMTPALLTVSIPTDERGKALYHAVQAVWSPRNKQAPPEKIRSGIANFGDTVRGLRDAWKAKNDNLRKAELPNSPTASDAPRLREEVGRYRTVMETVMARASMYGHPAIVKRYVHPLTIRSIRDYTLHVACSKHSVFVSCESIDTAHTNKPRHLEQLPPCAPLEYAMRPVGWFLLVHNGRVHSCTFYRLRTSHLAARAPQPGPNNTGLIVPGQHNNFY